MCCLCWAKRAALVLKQNSHAVFTEIKVSKMLSRFKSRPIGFWLWSQSITLDYILFFFLNYLILNWILDFTQLQLRIEKEKFKLKSEKLCFPFKQLSAVMQIPESARSVYNASAPTGIENSINSRYRHKRGKECSPFPVSSGCYSSLPIHPSKDGWK